MTKLPRHARRVVTVVAAFSFLRAAVGADRPGGKRRSGYDEAGAHEAGAPATSTQKPAAPAASTQKPATATPAGAAAPVPVPDGGWPRLYELKSGATALVYQPQVASWDQQKALVAYSAVSYHAKPTDKAQVGTLKIEATTKVSVTERLVNLQNMKITEANFPGMAKDNVRDIVSGIDSAIPDDERVIALDRVLANIDKSAIVPKNEEGVKADPPPIFFSKKPAIMLNSTASRSGARLPTTI